MQEKSELENLKEDLLDNVKDLNRDKVLMGVIVYMLITFLFYRGMALFFVDWYESVFFRLINYSLSFCWALIPLLIARQLKDVNIRTAGIIVASIYLFLSLATTIKEITDYFFF
ncbi:MAG: hypothetical protein AAF927_00670 [Bacteroidota bacterium]